MGPLRWSPSDSIECEGQDPGQGRNPTRPAEADLRRQAAGGWTHTVRLQHPERVDTPSGSATEGWHHRAQLENVGVQVQLRQDDLQKVLRSSSPEGHQLPQEEVWPHQQPATQEEAEVDARATHDGDVMWL